MQNLTKSGWLICISIIMALGGMALYIFTSTTGFLAGSTLKFTPIIFTFLAIVLACVLVGFTKKLHPLLIDVFLVASTLLIIASFSLFVLGRVSLVADIYFIPVNYPRAEEIALNISLIGIVFYMISIITMIIAAFSSKIRHE